MSPNPDKSGGLVHWPGLKSQYLNREKAADPPSTKSLPNYLLVAAGLPKCLVLVSKSKIAFGILDVRPAAGFKSKENTLWQRQKQAS